MVFLMETVHSLPTITVAYLGLAILFAEEAFTIPAWSTKLKIVLSYSFVMRYWSSFLKAKG